jgi:proteic killer suppression protein
LDISFKNKKLEKEFNEGKQLEKTHGTIRANKIRLRMKEFRAAVNLGRFWPSKTHPNRCHELVGNHKGHLSVDLDHPYRLIFCPNQDPIPRLEDGGLDWFGITAIEILCMEDTHE